MFEMMFRGKTAARLLAVASISGALTVAATSADAQTRQFIRQHTLSFQARQILYVVLSEFPPEGQRLVVNAVQALGPRAEAELIPLIAVPRELLRFGAQVVTEIVRHLPVHQRQMFVNGVFHVSAAEEQYANHVFSQVMQTVQATRPMDPEEYLRRTRKLRGMFLRH